MSNPLTFWHTVCKPQHKTAYTASTEMHAHACMHAPLPALPDLDWDVFEIGWEVIGKVQNAHSSTHHLLVEPPLGVVQAVCCIAWAGCRRSRWVSKGG